jgi:hypothetical protein
MFDHPLTLELGTRSDPGRSSLDPQGTDCRNRTSCLAGPTVDPIDGRALIMWPTSKPNDPAPVVPLGRGPELVTRVIRRLIM